MKESKDKIKGTFKKNVNLIMPRVFYYLHLIFYFQKFYS